MLFDENRENIKVLDEIAMIEDIANEVRKDYPYFQLMLILTCYKIVGKSHAKKIIGHIKEANQKFPHLIGGFDMVNEEDYNDPIDTFIEQILATKARMGSDF